MNSKNTPLPNADEEKSEAVMDTLASLKEQVDRLSDHGDGKRALLCSFDKLASRVDEMASRLSHESSLNDGLKQSLNRFQVIQNLCETIGMSKDVDYILLALLKTVPRVLSFSTAAIYLYNSESKTYTLRAEELLSPQHRSIIQTHFEEGIIPWVMSQKRAVIIPHLKEVKEESDLPVHGFVIVPLIAGESTIGFLEVWHDDIHEIRGEVHLSILELMARQAAIAIENSLLYDQLHSATKVIKKSQAQIITAEKMAAIGVLASGIAHEINNPLQVIFAKVQLLKRSATDEKLKNSLEVMERESLRISNIVGSILRNARNQNKPQLSPCDLNLVVRDVLTIAQSRLALHNVKLKVQLDEKLPPMPINAGEISQVLTNLIENARQAMPEGGTLTLKTKKMGKLGCLTVQDTGCGIPKESLKRLFEPFFTTKGPNEGTGLGLFLCYQIIERHFGKFRVDSRPGKGSEFTIELPLTIKTKSSITEKE
jgi:signal transduction histidine kinase